MYIIYQSSTLFILTSKSRLYFTRNVHAYFLDIVLRVCIIATIFRRRLFQFIFFTVLCARRVYVSSDILAQQDAAHVWSFVTICLINIQSTNCSQNWDDTNVYFSCVVVLQTLPNTAR